MTGLERIQKERRRQLRVENWTPKHDDEHTDGSLILAGLCYERIADVQAKFGFVPDEIAEAFDLNPRGWPWDAQWFKLGKTADRTYEKAGALCQAEIDRFSRMPAGLGEDYHAKQLRDARAAVVRIAAKIDALSPKSSKSR